MRIAVLGTGSVGQAHAGKLSNLGHKVVVGTHDPEKSLAKKESAPGSASVPFGKWAAEYPRVRIYSFAKAVVQADIVIEALNGEGVMDVLNSIKSELAGKTLIDISNPLDFSKGRPPTLFVCNDDSLGERIQELLPGTNIVKAFNTINATIQVSPADIANGDHHLFIAGESESAKETVANFAKEQYGWQKILDLGGIKSARGMEMVLPIWLELMGSLNSPKFNFKIAQ